jgi:two-component system, cell cycle sensor histidine kinase and response regulator CckA
MSASPEALLSTTGIAVVICDMRSPGQPIEYVNETFVDVTGYTAAESVGRNCRFLQGPDTDPAALHLMRQAIHSGKAIHVQLLNYKKDGTPFWNDLTLSPMVGPDGGVPRYLGVQRDVTAMRARAEELALAQRLATVGQLTAGVAHDLSNLVTGILGATELLNTQLAEDSPAADTARMLRSAAEQTAGHLRRLSSLARRQPDKPSAVDLRVLFQHLLRFLPPALHPKTHLNCTIADGVPPVLADPVALEAALLNLVVNARDALGTAGYIRVSAELDRTSQTPRVRIAVEDNGAGMSSSVRARAQEAFFTTKAPGKGTGLGLTMVRDFVAGTGGQLVISSAPGAGTSMSFSLPVYAQDNTETCASGAPRAAPAAGAPDLRGQWVVLVDDDPVVRLTTQYMLQHLGAQVQEFDSGDAFLEALSAGNIRADLLVTDLRMPGDADGLAVLAAARAWQARLPCVLATASAAESRDLIDTDVAILAKPYTLQEVAGAVREALAAV